jgi:hypothetical protein
MTGWLLRGLSEGKKKELQELQNEPGVRGYAKHLFGVCRKNLGNTSRTRLDQELGSRRLIL